MREQCKNNFENLNFSWFLRFLGMLGLMSGFGAKSRDGWTPRWHDEGLGMVPD